METLFYRINSKNSMKTFDNETLTQLKSALFFDLASNEEVSVGNEINKFFNKLLGVSIPTDKIDIIYSLVSEYVNANAIDLNDTVYNEKILDQITFRNYKMEFIFNAEFVSEVCTSICYGFHHMKNYKEANSLTYNKLLLIIKEIKDLKIDRMSSYKYGNSETSIKYVIPNEFLLLMNVFQGIKKIKMCLDENSTAFMKGCLLILLNYEWLFQNIFQIELDLTSMKMLNEINTYEKHKVLASANEKRKKSDSSDEGEAPVQPALGYSTIIKDNEDMLTLIVIFSYFIQTFNYLNNLTIIFPQSFKNEVSENLHQNGSSIASFHFLDFLSGLNNLLSIKIEFNSLERESFEKCLSLIQSNSLLRNLNINFFSKNEEYYTPFMLYKLANENGTSIDNVFIFKELSVSEPRSEAGGKLINKLISNFEDNFEKFFLLIQSKKNLDSLSISLDLPQVITSNEKYFLIFMKFLFNIFLMLNREKFFLNELKIIAPFLKFDNRKNPLIENFLDSVNLNEKNKNLKSFHFQVQLTQIPNLQNIISEHIQFLFLGDFDLETFKSFVEFYKSENFLEKSQLLSIQLSLRKSILDVQEVKKHMTLLLEGGQPRELKEFGFYSSVALSAKDLGEMLSLTNGNTVEKFTFQIKQNEPEEFLKFNYDQFWFSNKYIKDKIEKYSEILYKLNLLKEKKITKTIMKLSLPRNRKEIVILK